jgi:hypothetical protein
MSNIYHWIKCLQGMHQIGIFKTNGLEEKLGADMVVLNIDEIEGLSSDTLSRNICKICLGSKFKNLV